MMKKSIFIFTLLTITLFAVTTEANEDDIDMYAARKEVKSLITDFLQVVLNEYVTSLPSLMKISSFLINDFMFEELQKEVLNMGSDECNEFKGIIDSYKQDFYELLGRYEFTTEAMGWNTPMNAHLQNLQNMCGKQTLKYIVKKKSKTLKEILEYDKMGTVNLEEEGFDIETGKQTVVNALGAILQLVLDKRCHRLQTLINTSYYLISHHTNLNGYLEESVKSHGEYIINRIDTYNNDFFSLLDEAGIDGERIPMRDQLIELRKGCLEHYDDPNIDRQYENEGLTHMEGTSSGPLTKRAFSFLKPFRKTKTFS